MANLNHTAIDLRKRNKWLLAKKTIEGTTALNGPWQCHDNSMHTRMIATRTGVLVVAGLLCSWANAGGVQIRGLSDRWLKANEAMGHVGRSAGQGIASVRVSDNFCVVSDTRSAVSLAFTNLHGAANDGQSWVAKNAAGVPFNYLQFVSNSDASSELQVSRPGLSIFVVAAGKSVPVAECGAGNVTKSVVPTDGLPPSQSGNFTDIVTVVASPL